MAIFCFSVESSVYRLKLCVVWQKSTAARAVEIKKVKRTNANFIHLSIVSNGTFPSLDLEDCMTSF